MGNNNIVDLQSHTQFIGPLQCVSRGDVSLLLHTADQYLTPVLQLEEVETKSILGKYAIEQLRKRGSANEEKCHLLDAKGVTDRIMAPIDDRL